MPWSYRDGMGQSWTRLSVPSRDKRDGRYLDNRMSALAHNFKVMVNCFH